MTTAEMYKVQEGGPVTTPDRLSAFDVVLRIAESLQVIPKISGTASASVSGSLDLSVDTTATQERERQLRRELAALSLDPQALDRDSEIDIWGFHGEG